MVGVLAVVTSGQVLETVNDLLPSAKVFRPGDPAFAQLDAVYMKGMLQTFPSFAAITQQLLVTHLTAKSNLASPRDGVQIFVPLVTPTYNPDACTPQDLGLCGLVLLNLYDGATPVGTTKLTQDYKLGSQLLPKGEYAIAAIYDSQNKDHAIDPNEKTDFYLILWKILPGGDASKVETVAFIGLAKEQSLPILLAVGLAAGPDALISVLLNLVAALLQAPM
jgi:hypothetical protein